MSTVYSTSFDVEQMIISAVASKDTMSNEEMDAVREEFDIDAIAIECFEYDVEQDGLVQIADEEEFWDSVQRNTL